ncbi:MAG: hypothetical protein JW894_00945 [Bacteroidales bacterium]|nr:hypothetical protein [Bacteroidales bacterium]
MAKKIGLQCTFIPIKSDSTNFYSAAITGLYSIKRKKYVHSFLYLGNHLVVSDDDYEYNIGFGPGFSFGSFISYNLMLGYGFYDITNTFSLFPTIEMGLYFKF